MKQTFLWAILGVVVALGAWWLWGLSTAEAPVVTDNNNDEPTACTADTQVCPDGSSVGREGPECEFAACPSKPVDPAVTTAVAELEDRITITTPQPGAYVASPLRIAGEARGTWFFEGDFAVVLTDWDGRIIAEAPATAQDEWMTEDWVSFTGELSFTSPYTEGDPEFMQRGSLILERANPSGLPENAAALEFPVWFRPAS